VQIDHQQVEALLREAAAREILPLWRNLHDHQVEEKQRNDVVTVADRACEAWLGGRLQALLPGSLVVGEEAAHDDPSIMAALESVRPVWIIDPLDGTNNFAAGQEPIAVMVCLVRQGETLAAWIYDPLGDSLLSAEKGAGTSLDGQTIRLTPHEGPAAGINGALSTKYLPDAMKPAARSGASQLGKALASGCAGYDYRAMATGIYQFQFYYRTLPWDHAPGALIVEEAGGVARRYDGRPYRPEADGRGLITACDAQTWAIVRDALL
jgi:fructose-1,6-bisphosphatase/inositol monophosphatase family enzyme